MIPCNRDHLLPDNRANGDRASNSITDRGIRLYGRTRLLRGTGGIVVQYKPMRILLIAPDQPNIEAKPEIRALTEMHHTHVMSNGVTAKEAFEAARLNRYDVVHVATHMESPPELYDTVSLSKGEVLTLQDMAQICRLANAKLAFFNFCAAARFGAYVSRNSNAAAIFTTVHIRDNSAWKLPFEFYTRIMADEQAGIPMLNYREVFEAVNDSSGIYAWSSSAMFYANMFAPINDSIKKLDHRMSDGFKRQETRIDGLARTVENHTAILGAPRFNRASVRLVFYGLAGIVGIASLITVAQSIAQWWG